MASIKEQTTKSGKRFYYIQVSQGRGKSALTTRWYPEENWSRKYAEQQVKKFAAEFEKKCNSGEIVSLKERKRLEKEAAIEASRIKTVHAYGEQVYIKVKALECKENTRKFYSYMLNSYIYPELGDYKINTVTATEIKRLIVNLQSKGFSHSTVKGTYKTIQQLFAMALEEGLIPANPCDKVPAPKRLKKEGIQDDVKCFDIEETKQIIKLLNEENTKWRCIFLLMLKTGMRRGEVAGLNWRSINFKTGEIKIENNLCYSSGIGVYEETPKNGKSRIVYIDEELMDLLKEIKAEQYKNGFVSRFVFTRDSSTEPMSPQSITRHFAMFGKKHGIDDCHPHKFRHTFASIAITNGADVKSISELLGHSDTSITLNIYTHANEEAQRKAANILNYALSL